MNNAWNEPPKPSRSRLLDGAAVIGLLGLAAFVAFMTLTGRLDGSSISGGGQSESATPQPDRASGTSDASVTQGSSEGDVLLPVTFQEVAAGDVEAVDVDFGPHCDPETGRVAIPTVYAPPCVANINGIEATNAHRGVDAETIRVVIYRSPPNDVGASLSTLSGSPEDQRATVGGYVELFSAYFETWGRSVELIEFTGSGLSEVAARSDAQFVANELGAFASLNGPSQQPAYADELAALEVLCFNCGLGVPDSTFQANAPHMWGSLQTPEQFMVNISDYLFNRVYRRPAIHAGDPAFHDRERTFAVVHFDQDPPVYDEVREVIVARGAEVGWEAEVILSYQLDGTMAQRAREIISQLKSRQVTTVILMGDPIMPSFLTREATTQDYFPEWMITGTVLTDTSAIGRGYDQLQWANAFGVSSLGVPVGFDQHESWLLYEWFHDRDPETKEASRFVFETTLQLMTGIHLAGPELNPETFAAGLFSYPTSGGTATAPQISYGEGVFDQPDYQGYDDVVEIWWDPQAEGLDEIGREGTGMMRYSNNGQRYVPGEMPSTDLSVFDPATSITGFDGIPESERPKSYPKP